jgi:hypothetical protein
LEAHARKGEMMNKELFNEEQLANSSADKALSICLEQYKLYVEMADRVSNRRSSLNNFYLTLNTAALAVLANTLINSSKTLILTISILGFFISILWSQKISSYKNLNKVKFGIINEIEDKLPIKPYKYEWNILKLELATKSHNQITDLEQNLPHIFAFTYLGIFLYLIFK